MHLVLVAFAIGIVAGMRTVTPLAFLSWAARVGWVPLSGTPLAFLGYVATPYVFTAFALFEFVVDQLPNTPSRLRPGGFIPRVLSGGFAGAAIGLSLGSVWGGLLPGLLGAVGGTLGGAAIRVRLAAAFGGRDLPAGLLEDAVAILGGYLIMSHAL